MAERRLTWVGDFEGTGAFPSINRHLVAEMEKLGWRILRNFHNDGGVLTPILISNLYPPTPPNVRHERNLCLSTWEFGGPRGVPNSFLNVFAQFDAVWTHCHWAADCFILCGAQRVIPGYLGIDPQEFAPEGPIESERLQAAPENAVKVLWVGGTDARHGFDVAMDVLHGLPDNYWLVAKQSIHYPPAEAQHERLILIREDLPSLAPLYRACDVLLHSARATGTSLPVLEALACGLPVVTTDLPAMHEASSYGDVAEHMALVPGKECQTRHHIHKDCSPFWIEPDRAGLVAAVSQFGQRDSWHASQAVRALWTWADSAYYLTDVLDNWGEYVCD